MLAAERTHATSAAVEEGAVEFRLVEELQAFGINVADITKLREAGLVTCGCILQHPMKDLLAIRGISEAKADKIKEAARKLDGNSSRHFRTGRELRERRKKVIRLTSGSKALNAILGGGIETGSLTEFFGEFRTGKTQISHTLCVTGQLSFDSGGGQGKAIYIDTEGNFRPERIENIANRYGLDEDETLDNVIVSRVYTHEEQMSIMKSVAALLSDPEQGPFRVLIIDSVIALFRTEFSGRGELSERQQKLGQHLAELTRLAEEFNIAVILVNQCTADPGAVSLFGPVIKPVGGNILAHASTTRVMLKKSKDDQRIAKIYDSPCMPEAEATFRITNGGIDDVE